MKPLLSIAKLSFVSLSLTNSNNNHQQSNKPDPNPPTSLLARAQHSLFVHNDTDTAFSLLTQAYAQDATQPGLLGCFKDLFQLRIEANDNAVDRMGLGSILLEYEQYGAAALQLERAIQLSSSSSSGVSRSSAAAMLFAARAAVCDWNHIEQDSISLVDSVRSSLKANQIPAVHPYKALMWPCLSLADATAIASKYAMRAMNSVPIDESIQQQQQKEQQLRTIESPPPSIIRVESRRPSPNKRIRLGYLSPDFTGAHPLAFLMQDVFRFHNTADFQLHIYSLVESDGSPEVEKIRQAAGDKWTVLPPSTIAAATTIRRDDLDILIDLCGYTGTSAVAEIMAQRVAPVQIGYMGFPASSGAPFITHMICDPTVVPSSLRRFYSESLILMPNCYFVNSHRFLTSKEETILSRATYNLPENSFVFCCHSRPEKIDPVAFRSWLRVLTTVPNSILWLLRSGDEMEQNLRIIAKDEFNLGDHRLVFCDKAPRDDHLLRLKLADLFLDTPAYGAHTVGCDCLSAGVPMVSLLRTDPAPHGEVETDKLASRVGASLLKAIGLDDVLIAPTMEDYEAIMIRCATDANWFSTVNERLQRNRDSHPLFDTERWVRNLEAGLLEIVLGKESQLRDADMHIFDADIHIFDNDND